MWCDTSSPASPLPAAAKKSVASAKRQVGHPTTVAARLRGTTIVARLLGTTSARRRRRDTMTGGTMTGGTTTAARRRRDTMTGGTTTAARRRRSAIEELATVRLLEVHGWGGWPLEVLGFGSRSWNAGCVLRRCGDMRQRVLMAVW